MSKNETTNKEKHEETIINFRGALILYDCTRSYWFCDTIGPTAVFGSARSPTGKEAIVSRIARLTASKRLFGTRSRVPAAQACPLFIKASMRAAGIAFSRAASCRLPGGADAT